MACRLAHYFCLMSQAPCHLSNQKRDRYRMFSWTYYKSFSFSCLPRFLIKKLSHCPPYFCPYPRWFHSGVVIVQEMAMSWIKWALTQQCQAGYLCFGTGTASHTDIIRWRPMGRRLRFVSCLSLVRLDLFPVSAPSKQQLFTWVLAATELYLWVSSLTSMTFQKNMSPVALPVAADLAFTSPKKLVSSGDNCFLYVSPAYIWMCYVYIYTC